jgi:hypothetical protein
MVDETAGLGALDTTRPTYLNYLNPLRSEHAPFVLYQWTIEPELFKSVQEYVRKKRMGLAMFWNEAFNADGHPGYKIVGQTRTRSATWPPELLNYVSKLLAEKAVLCDKLEENGIDPLPLVLITKLGPKPRVVLTSTWDQKSLILLAKWYSGACRRVLDGVK